MVDWKIPVQQMLESRNITESAHYVLDGVVYSVSIKKLGVE